MEIKIIEEKENPLLDRTELWVELETDNPVKRDELKAKISALKNAKEDLVIIDKIMHKRHYKRAYIKIYHHEDAMKKLEPEHKIKKNMKKEEGEQNDQT